MSGAAGIGKSAFDASQGRRQDFGAHGLQSLIF